MFSMSNSVLSSMSAHVLDINASIGQLFGKKMLFVCSFLSLYNCQFHLLSLCIRIVLFTRLFFYSRP